MGCCRDKPSCHIYARRRIVGELLVTYILQHKGYTLILPAHPVPWVDIDLDGPRTRDGALVVSHSPSPA